MKTTSRFIVLAVSLLAVTAAYAAKPEEDKGKAGDKAETAPATPVSASAQEKAQAAKSSGSEKAKNRSGEGFDPQSREILGEYLKGRGSWKNDSTLPPGLQKKAERGGTLPPGWQKKLELGEPMPGDIYKAARPLPEKVRERLPKDPEGTETVQIEDQVYRVTKGTRDIIDIIGGMGKAGD